MERNREKRKLSIIFLCFTYILFFTNPSASVAKSLIQGRKIIIGDILVSDAATFGLQFFNLVGDNNWYLGISYRFDDNSASPVWLANRDKPISDDLAMLTIDDRGSLVIKYGVGESLSLYSVRKATTTFATLEDNGNFVLRDNATKEVLWQSFDHPTDTLLPEMKLGFNRRTGQSWFLTSWRNSQSSPSSGFYTFGIDPNRSNELTIWWRGHILWRSGAWRNESGTFSNTKFPSSLADAGHNVHSYSFHFSSTNDEVYFNYSVHKNASAEIQDRERPKFYISDIGELMDETYESLMTCSPSKLKTDWDNGCDNQITPDCRGHRYEIGNNFQTRGFMSSKGFMIEDDIHYEECEAICRRNCSCSAFSNDLGCVLWSQGTNYRVSDDAQANSITFVDKVNETSSQILQDHDLQLGQELSSSSQNFTLKFFRTNNSTGWYLGIWHRSDNIKPIWVANRNDPIIADSVWLTIDGNGSLVIKYGHGKFLSLYSVVNDTSTSATLEDNGNFVLRNQSSYDVILWQSFDHPTDTLLPDMKLGFNKTAGQIWSLTSWRTDYSFANGSFTLGVDSNRPNELTIWWRGQIYWRSGAWQNGTFNCTSASSTFAIDYKINHISSNDGVYFSFSSVGIGANPKLLRLSTTRLGELNFGQNQTSFRCSISQNNVKGLDSGCKKQPDCRSHYYKNGKFPVAGIGFMSTMGFKFKDSENMTSYDCEATCWNSCSCMAYSNASGCEIWSEGTEFRADNDPRAQKIIFLGKYERAGNKILMKFLITIGALLGLLIFCYAFYVILKKIKIEVERILKRIMLIREIGGRTGVSTLYEMAVGRSRENNFDNEIKIFSFRSIVIATKNFSVANKLGQGGFGSVYKGELLNGQEIAIKRLSERSGQGLVEFKNEAILMARLQHTNLIRVLGYCIEREERILVYEYMPNKSLDYYIFDTERKEMLNWDKRFNIIEGIVHGLVYLHLHSRLSVIHRDLKASNILLDNDINPKISDFGMARIFQQRGIEEITNRIVGTHGYMAPEYVLSGNVSIKTDIFSFGVLMLEIISGKKNNSSYHLNYPHNLIGLTWKLWNEDKVLELIDISLLDCCPTHEVLRCVQLGLLCVQDRATDRPNTLEVVSMLSNKNALMPTPRKPSFYIHEDVDESNGSEAKPNAFSINEVTVTKMEGR